MLDENLPAFFYKRSTEGIQHHTAIFLSHHGSDPAPVYTLQHADPSTTQSRNCYAAALFDSYNPDVLYGETLIRPGWTHPSLSQEDIRRNGGVPPPPAPILPTEFTIQLYNPDQQVTVIQKPGSLVGSASYEFSMPQTTFRAPSASTLDRTLDDPAASATTVKLNFVWRRESKLSKDLTCFMTGKSTDAVAKKKHRDPDIAIALFRSLREMTIYEPNLSRVEMEDPKGLEVVLLVAAAAIKDIYFSSNMREAFNIVDAPHTGRSSSDRRPSPSAQANSGFSTPGQSGPAQSSTVVRKDLPRLQTPNPLRPATTTASTVAGANTTTQYARPSQPAPPPLPDARAQWELDAETARLRAQTDAEAREEQRKSENRRRERDRADEAETRRLRKAFEAEAREAQKKQEAVDRETERLKRQYGVPQQHQHQQQQQQQQYQQPPHLPQRPLSGPAAQQRPSTRPAGSNGLYLQPNSASYASSSAVMSGAIQGGASSSSQSQSGNNAQRLKKKSFFGLRSVSDDAGNPNRLSKKASAMW